MENEEFKYKELTSKIIACFYNVYNELGFGFLEKIYKNALRIELEKNSLNVECEVPIKVYYDDNIVGEYFADIVVENCLILELKAVDILIKEHELQLINYLKATKFEIGLLFNFGKQPEIKRKIYTNNLKHTHSNDTA